MKFREFLTHKRHTLRNVQSINNHCEVNSHMTKHLRFAFISRMCLGPCAYARKIRLKHNSRFIERSHVIIAPDTRRCCNISLFTSSIHHVVHSFPMVHIGVELVSWKETENQLENHWKFRSLCQVRRKRSIFVFAWRMPEATDLHFPLAIVSLSSKVTFICLGCNGDCWMNIDDLWMKNFW